jgi:hypothetical protein
MTGFANTGQSASTLVLPKNRNSETDPISDIALPVVSSGAITVTAADEPRTVSVPHIAYDRLRTDIKGHVARARGGGGAALNPT